jgi:2-dehydropantoate 2-reductase
MTQEKTKVTVVGAGAIGGVTAAFLAKAGWDVEIVCKHQEIVDRCLNPGLRVTGIRGEFVAPVKAVKQISDLSGPLDTVILATKATECVSAAQALLPLLSPDSSVLSMQNGICEEALAEVLGRDRVIGCVVVWGASMLGPAELEVTSEGEFFIGCLDKTSDDRLPLIRHMLSDVVPTRISNNIMGELYSKLIINSCINSLGAVTGMTLGNLLANHRTRCIFIEIMKEAIAVAKAMKINVEPGGGGKLDYYKFIAGDGILSSLKRHATIRVIGFKYRRIKSSSLQSLERGRPTEVDYLNGYICKNGNQHDVATPVNEAIVAIIKEIEAGRRKIGPANLDDPKLNRVLS